MTKDMLYGTLNQAADAGYFDVHFTNSPVGDIDLGDTAGGDITFKDVRAQDNFNTFVLNYNKTTSESVSVIVLRYQKSPSIRCDFEDYESPSGCSSLQKYVVNTMDPTQNGRIE